jgi:hypothetical protein
MIKPTCRLKLIAKELSMLGEHAPCSCNGGKVGLGDPRVPMVLQCVQGGLPILELTKCPLVDYVGIACIVKQGRGNPRLYAKPG